MRPCIQKLQGDREHILEDTYDTIFTIHFLQLFYNILSSIWTTIIHDNDLKVHIPGVQNQNSGCIICKNLATYLYECNTFSVSEK